jgi:hypothetical protein
MAPTNTTEFHLDANGLPLTGSRWRHHSGRVYVVLMVTNEASDRQDKFPTTAVYQGNNGKRWSRPVSEFLEKMTPEA